jgi:aminomuconate-semialdehyde/2-hydroxymuconate-6-semialdehyde dehydrogenase
MTGPIELTNYIGGEWQSTGQNLENLEPGTAKVLSKIPRSQAVDVDSAVKSASSAFESWRRTPAGTRADLLDAIASNIEANLEEFAQLESRDTGKPISLARNVDIPRAIANFRFFAGAIRHESTEAHSMGHALNYTLRRPIGVAALITPWNLPLYLLSWKTAPALAMGNTVVAKPSELTPMTADRLAKVFEDVKAPKGIFNVVHGLGVEAGDPLVRHRDVGLVSFTGGTATGKLVAAHAAPQFKKLSLELGGKNPTIVFDDCDFDDAVEGTVRAGFLNQGQICLCGSRIFIQRGIYERFRAVLVERVSAMKVGNPADAETRVGALISAAHREKVEGYLALATEEGGSILCGGTRPELTGEHSSGFFLNPTVIDGLAPQCRTATEEIFGPVVTLHPFDTEDEAIEQANDIRYGLAASVWTTNLRTAHRVAAELESGMVWVNTWLMRDLRVPFGGMKDSGVGREGGWHSLEFYSEARNVCINLGGPQ